MLLKVSIMEKVGLIFLGPIHSLALSDEDNFLVAGLDDASITMWDLATKDIIFHHKPLTEAQKNNKATMNHHTKLNVAITNDCQNIIYGFQNENSLMVYDIKTKNEVQKFEDVTESKIYFRSKNLTFKYSFY